MDRDSSSRTGLFIQASGELPQVLILTDTPSPQKTPVFDGLDNEGVDMRVIYLRRASPKANWGLLQLDHNYELMPNRLVPALKLFWTILRSGTLRVLVCHGYRGPLRIFALNAARIRRVPIIIRSDSNILAVQNDPLLKSTVRRFIIRRLVPRDARIWTIGVQNAQYWRKYVGRNNTRLIPYSTPTLPNSLNKPIESRRSNQRNLTLLYVGRLAIGKNVATLIDAFRMLDDVQYAGWTLHIVGDGPLADSLRLKSAEDPRIEFHGACPYDQLDRFYRSADVLVLPSVYEAWGLVSNEALGFGLRLLLSNTVGSAELITDSRVGETFPPEDSSALAKSLERSINYLERSPVEPYDPVKDMFDDLSQYIDGSSNAKT